MNYAKTGDMVQRGLNISLLTMTWEVTGETGFTLLALEATLVDTGNSIYKNKRKYMTPMVAFVMRGCST